MILSCGDLYVLVTDRLKKIEDWYRLNGEEVAKLADKIKYRMWTLILL